MANCDVAQFITNAGGFTAENLGGARRQNAMLAWVLMYSLGQTSDTLLKAQVSTTRIKLGPANRDQVTAGLINSLLAYAVRAGQPAQTVAQAVASADYLFALDDDALFMLFADNLCGVLSALVP